MPRFNITLNNLQFYSHIGVYDQERIVGNDFRVDVKVSFPADSFKSEDLTSTISYADIYAIVHEEMHIEHRLIETVCVKIAQKIKDISFSDCSISVKIAKISPPIGGCTGDAEVEYII